MSKRKEALHWLETNYPREKNPVYTSKLYMHSESWNGETTWWIEIPIGKIYDNYSSYVNLLLVNVNKDGEFYYLQVPNNFLIKNLSAFYKNKDKISLYFSPEPTALFEENRNESFIQFFSFYQRKGPTKKYFHISKSEDAISFMKEMISSLKCIPFPEMEMQSLTCFISYHYFSTILLASFR